MSQLSTAQHSEHTASTSDGGAGLAAADLAHTLVQQFAHQLHDLSRLDREVVADHVLHLNARLLDLALLQQHGDLALLVLERSSLLVVGELDTLDGHLQVGLDLVLLEAKDIHGSRWYSMPENDCVVVHRGTLLINA
eukprot:CAMPEP_0173249318 /NCGR_PEP_ID=MMETSP1142-20121109/18957_1 /TAXON_ID=483371 /ORGANISM="non described non described, Strain CCMP2298" /LENGTH=136 /DNA_ID=CAMNT_0014181941 /DNA_START=746 /DNA_END=1155 /DNA_ORIENTATION=+